MEVNKNSVDSPTMDVGGAVFSTTKTISSYHNDDEPTTLTDSTVLVAKGKSYLSYFYLGVCSSVLYLAPEATNDAILFQENDDDDDGAATPVALEIHYHKPARAVDFQWAMRTFIENNLQENKKITDLPLTIQQQLTQFNALYKNVQIGDRYLLQYIPGTGIRLLLNNELLGTVGMDLRREQQQELARLIYSVWFGQEAPFSESMKKELLTPVEIPALPSKGRAKTTTMSSSSSNAILATDSQKKSSNIITEEESELLESLGILQLLKEESNLSSTKLSDPPPPSTNKKQPTNTQARDNTITNNYSNLDQPLPALTRIRHLIFPPKSTVSLQPKKNPMNAIDAASETGTSIDKLTLSSATSTTTTNDDTEDQSPKYNPILLGLGGAAFLLPHLFVLLSLPPVLLRRGAPYLPTFGGKLNTTFDIIRGHILHSRHMQRKQSQQSLKFVDLGSGDGRVVFRADREGLFAKSVGYEINPALHVFANCRRIMTPRYWSTTQFYMRDLWKIQLHQYDVVAVYGLSPIMKRLGKKLEEELKPGSIVVSNVFEIPGWRVNDMNRGKGVYLYSVPECFGGKK